MFNSNEDFFRLFANIFRTQRYINPNELGIKCYGVIDTFISIQDEQVDKDISEKNKPFFWSQQWQSNGYPTNNLSFEYPLLAVRQSGYNVNDPFRSSVKYDRSFDLLLVDKLYLQETERSNPLKRRNKFEIYEDCFTLLRNFLETLKTVNAYDYNSEIIFLPSGYIDNLPDSSDFVYNSDLSMKFKAKLALTDDFNYDFFWGTGSNLYGVNISELRFLLDPCSISVIPPSDTIVNFV